MSLLRALNTTVGKKYVMAITGLLLCGFLVFHLAGNLLMYVGPEMYNEYAHTLHSTEPLLYVAETGLALLFLVHLYLAISTALENTRARRRAYTDKESKISGGGARPDTWMFASGAVVFLFLILHITDFTVEGRESLPAPLHAPGAYTKPAEAPNGSPLTAERLQEMDFRELAAVVEHNHLHLDVDAFTEAADLRREIRAELGESFTVEREPYDKAVTLLQNPITVAVYLVGVAFLAFHLAHGFRSAFQSLGANGPAWNPIIRWLGILFAIAIPLGFASFPLLGYAGMLPK